MSTFQKNSVLCKRLELNVRLKLTSLSSFFVTGAGIYVESTDTVLSNNSLISNAKFNKNIPSFRCLSGSSQPRVGRLIDPLKNDVTFSTSDPFFISRGGQHDPGTLYVRSLREFEPTDSGVYTYRTPDENGYIVDFNVGLYHYNISSTVE